MKRRKDLPAWLGVGIFLAAMAACGDPSGPTLPELEVVVAAGDGQFGALGQILLTRLHAVVRTVSTGDPRKDVTVLWQVESGDASFVTAAAAVTDSAGSTFATVRLGSTPGDVVIRVSTVDQETATTTFTVHAVDSPQLTGLSVSEARAGDTITVQGLNFLSDAVQNVVLFSGIRGTVTSAGSGELRVEVPACLPTRTVDVEVLLGSVASGSLPLSVTDGGHVTTLSPGEVLDVPDPSAPGCLRLAGGGHSYLAVAYSAATVGAATHAASFVGLSSTASGLSSVARAQPKSLAVQVERGGGRVQESWDRDLRRREAGLLAGGGAGPVPIQRTSGRGEVPSVGDERTFTVLNAEGGFDEVVAIARYVGQRAVLYEDKAAPAEGFTASDLESFSDAFDQVIYPTVTGAFGSPSDVDENDRIVILFTTAVNKLTPRGSTGGFVGGFFFGLDLLTDSEGNKLEGSNQGEIFYALVPDPSGEVADPHSKSQVLDVTPAILAHEFQHMIHFNQRVLVLEAPGGEALWLSEGLAQMAEELVARAYGASPRADDFRAGNLARARRYLADPLAVSLIVATGQGSLEERGAGWLHVLYLTESFGEGILGRLTATVRTGVENVAFEAGRPWGSLLSDWWAALYLDGRGDFAPELGFGSFDLRGRLIRPPGPDALQPVEVGQTDFQDELSFWSSSARHYLLRPPVGGSTVIRLGGEGGAAAPAGSALGLRIVRLF